VCIQLGSWEEEDFRSRSFRNQDRINFQEEQALRDRIPPEFASLYHHGGAVRRGDDVFTRGPGYTNCFYPIH
jgi:hypothetical protein